MSDAENNQPTDRRGFFRDGLASLLGPLADVVERRLERVRESFEAASAPPPPPPRLLRPPGALPEAEFVRTCTACGSCAKACPVAAIQIRRDVQPLPPDAPDAATPFICAAEQPCVVCDALACMAACPSGALRRLPAERIHIGTAEWTPQLCLRTCGEDCTACVDTCPRGPAALSVAEQTDPAVRPPVVVHYAACVGCGMCEHHCPTEPRAIVVQPIR